LGITAAQDPQWSAFADVMRGSAAHLGEALRARSANPAMNAVDDLRTYTAIAEAQAEDLRKLLPAFESLYASLTPAQQHAADVLFRNSDRHVPHKAKPRAKAALPPAAG
jgi:hypothetical protein